MLKGGRIMGNKKLLKLICAANALFVLGYFLFCALLMYINIFYPYPLNISYDYESGMEALRLRIYIRDTFQQNAVAAAQWALYLGYMAAGGIAAFDIFKKGQARLTKAYFKIPVISLASMFLISMLFILADSVFMEGRFSGNYLTRLLTMGSYLIRVSLRYIIWCAACQCIAGKIINRKAE